MDTTERMRPLSDAELVRQIVDSAINHDALTLHHSGDAAAAEDCVAQRWRTMGLHIGVSLGRAAIVVDRELLAAVAALIKAVVDLVRLLARPPAPPA